MRSPKPQVLIVEGRDECHVLPAFFEAAGIDWLEGNEPVWFPPESRNNGGVPTILEPDYVSAQLKASGLQALGIIVDNDTDPSARWCQVRNAIVPHCPDVPQDCPEDGWVHLDVAAGEPRLGVWMMPAPRQRGMLETLLLEARIGGSELREYAATATARATELQAPYKYVHRAKAELHTWLAWQDPPAMTLSLAVKKRLLTPNPAALGLVAWFKRLFPSRV